MARINLFLIHGFLGRPQDWSGLKRYLSAGTHLAIYTPDLFNNTNLTPQNSFRDWAKNFNMWAEGLVGSSDSNILVGYSLGGRLALHALEQAPLLWSRSIIISANPGFLDEEVDLGSEERKVRWFQDTYWADQFLKSDWSQLMKDWNSQGIFSGGGMEPLRQEVHYSRELLGLALTRWSLSQQRNLRPLIRREAQDIHWIVGERDEKFCQIAQELKEAIPELHVHIVANSGHRVIFDSPQAINTIIEKLIGNLF